LAREIKEKFKVEVNPWHLNYLLRKRGLAARLWEEEERRRRTGSYG